MSAAPREPRPLRLTIHPVSVEVPDDQLAEHIRAEGRRRLERGESIALADFLKDVPGIEHRPLAFDAAIDIALRSLSKSALPNAGAVEALIATYPEHQEAIRTAAVLSAMLWRTDEGVAARISGPSREVPCDFGPVGADGQARYELEARIGRGSSGEVFRAIDRCLSSGHRPARVAIKILRASRADDVSRARFIEEASKARLLDHPNAVRVFDRGETPDGELYIVYELVEDGDLHAWIGERAESFTAEQAVRLIEQIAEAIQSAHAAGLVHLDLKPANILMTHDGHPKVADFGLSLHGASARLDGHGSGDSRIGTLAFMAPEQFLDEPGAASPQADIYALGGVLQWLLTSTLPNGQTVDEIRDVHMSEVWPESRVRAAWNGVRPDRNLVAICCRALAPKKADRYKAAGELAADLRAWLDLRPIEWTMPNPAGRALLFARRRPGVSVLAIALCVALVGALVASEQARVHAAASHAMELQARTATERLAADNEWRQWASDDLARRLGAFSSVRKSGLAGEVLVSLWILESVHGPTLLGNPQLANSTRENRIDTVRELLASSTKTAGAQAHDTLQLRALLAFLLTKHGDFIEAEASARACLEGWNGRLAPNDPWLADLEAIRLSAAAGVAVDSLCGDAPTGGAHDELLSMERALRDQCKRLAMRPDGAPLRLMILERLRTIYAPTCLGNSEWSEWAEGMIASLGVSEADAPVR